MNTISTSLSPLELQVLQVLGQTGQRRWRLFEICNVLPDDETVLIARALQRLRRQELVVHDRYRWIISIQGESALRHHYRPTLDTELHS